MLYQNYAISLEHECKQLIFPIESVFNTLSIYFTPLPSGAWPSDFQSSTTSSAIKTSVGGVFVCCVLCVHM